MEVAQTHISLVLLAREHVFKLKKPVDFGFLDFSTPERRLHFAREEIRLNRRLAPGVYLGLSPVSRAASGELSLGPWIPPGDASLSTASEWAVVMRRLPGDRTLEAILERGEFDDDLASRVARRLADFHARADRSDTISSGGRWESVARNLRDTVETIRRSLSDGSLASATEIPAAAIERLNRWTEAGLSAHRERIERRAREGRPCDAHGDLHLDHLYWLPDLPPPDDLVVVDCIEFTERFRHIDPVADVAFLTMDLAWHGRPDLAERFAREWIEAGGDEDAAPLLPLYEGYRAAVRAKVELLALAEAETPDARRPALARAARSHLLLALGRLASPSERPCLAIACGLPGTGKSELARRLARELGFERVSSDRTRKELFPGSATERLYCREATDQVYEICLARVRAILLSGGRAVLDATFVEGTRRDPFFDLAEELRAPILFLANEAPREVVLPRLSAGDRDSSDADEAVYELLARRWEPFSERLASCVARLDAREAPEGVMREARAALEARGLA